MGDFSRDPDGRLADSIAKHYVGVRLQQGVPLLDADWNELEDLRRHELATLGAWLLGDGAPNGSDGFRITSVAGGGIATIILTAGTTGTRLSTVTIDLAASTAAGALGFDDQNFSATRFGSSPARLTGNRTEPFPLADGQTLTIQTDDGTPETITFNSGDFVDITAATAAEVVAAIAAVVNLSTASVGAGNDFIIKGGDDPTSRAGALLVEGRLALNRQDLKYTEQPLYLNDALAEAWGVDPVDALTTPAGDTLFIVYLDVWNREVNSTEDAVLVDPRIGVETALRLRREWAVRVADALSYPNVVTQRPAGHTYYPLSELSRTSDPAINADMIADRRDTDISARREVAYRSATGTVLVDTAAFRALLVTLRNNVRDFVDFLTMQFVDPGEAYLAGEVAGIDALSAIAGLADQGITLLDAQTLGTQGAFAFFEQLRDAESRFITVWRDAVLPIEKPEGHVYEQSYEGMIDAVEAFLTGPAPAGFTSVSDALNQRNLMEARRSQEQINNEFGEELDRPTGVLVLTYLGSPAPAIQRDVPFDMEFEVTGSVTPEDDLDVEVFIGTEWQTTLRNEDGSLPLSLTFGPGEDTARFLLTVRTPDVAAAETQLSLRISARQNSGALYHITSQKTLSIGDLPPPSEEDFAFTLTASVPTVEGVFQVPASSAAIVTFRLWNNTEQALDANLEFSPSTDPLWQIVPGSFDLNNQNIPAGGNQEFSFQFTAPSAPDNTLTFHFEAQDASTSDVVAETQISLISV